MTCGWEKGKLVTSGEIFIMYIEKKCSNMAPCTEVFSGWYLICIVFFVLFMFLFLFLFSKEMNIWCVLKKSVLWLFNIISMCLSHVGGLRKLNSESRPRLEFYGRTTVLQKEQSHYLQYWTRSRQENVNKGQLKRFKRPTLLFSCRVTQKGACTPSVVFLIWLLCRFIPILWVWRRILIQLSWCGEIICYHHSHPQHQSLLDYPLQEPKHCAAL